jgi:hypothetical protein
MKTFWSIVMIVSFVLAVYFFLTGLNMIYEPLFYIGLGIFCFTIAKSALSLLEKKKYENL